MMRIARIYEPPRKSDGWRVLVDRLWPRGVSKQAARVDEWMKEIAPSDRLRRWFGHQPGRWAEFQKRYRAELAKKKALLDGLRAMEKQHGAVTLLFAARDQQHNQAVVLRALLKGRR